MLIRGLLSEGWLLGREIVGGLPSTAPQRREGLPARWAMLVGPRSCRPRRARLRFGLGTESD